MVVEEKIENKNPFSLSDNGDEYQLESLNNSENEIIDETLNKHENGNEDHGNNEDAYQLESLNKSENEIIDEALNKHENGNEDHDNNEDEYQLESLNKSENEISDETLGKHENENMDHSNEDEREVVITEEPKPLHMEIPDHPVDHDDGSSMTVSEVGSGYQNETNECHEFCLDFCTCFGLFSTCCPSTGEGFVTSCAAFCGTFLVSCIKC